MDLANTWRRARERGTAWRGWASWLLVVLLLPGLLRLPWPAIGHVLRGLTLDAWLGLAALNALFLGVSTWRWRVLLHAAHSTRAGVAWTRLLVYRLAGFAVSYFTPGTQFGGEPLQVYALHRREGVPLAAAWASVGLDRLLDLTANTGFVLFALAGMRVWLSRGPLPEMRLWLLLALVGVVVAGWAGLCGVRWSPRAAGWRGTLAQAAHLCRARPRAMLAAAGLSLAGWGVLLAEYHWMLRALGLRPTWSQTVTMMLAARLAFLVPVPAGVGALEMGQVWAAAWVGWPRAYGAALSLLIRARDGIIGGLGLFFSRRLWSSSARPRAQSHSGGVS